MNMHKRRGRLLSTTLFCFENGDFLNQSNILKRFRKNVLPIANSLTLSELQTKVFENELISKSELQIIEFSIL